MVELSLSGCGSRSTVELPTVPVVSKSALESDPFPRGTPLNVLRSPHSPRSDSFPNREALARQREEDARALIAQVMQKDPPITSAPPTIAPSPSKASSSVTRSTSKDDLARRAQRRVLDQKRTESERRQEQEAIRLQKREQELKQREQAQRVKARRRAEIYALNAIMRRVQQEKIAKFIRAQEQHHRDPSHPALLVPSIGV